MKLFLLVISILFVGNISAQNLIAEFDGPYESCIGQTLYFTDYSTPQDSIMSWSWTFGDGSTSTLQNPTHVYPYEGYFTVTLIIEGTLGDTDTISYNITVNDLQASFDISTYEAYVGDSIAFTDVSYTTSGITDWYWDFGDGNTSNVSNPNHVYNQAGVYLVSLSIIDYSGCVSYFDQQITIHIKADFKINPEEACEGEGVVFTDLSLGGSINDWQWTFGDGGTSIAQNPTWTYSAPGTYDVTLIVTDTLSNIDTLTQQLIIHSPSFVEFSVPNIPICSNEEYVDLNEYVNLGGGEFSTEIFGNIEDGILDITQFNINNFPLNSFIEYYYTNPEGCQSYASSSLTIYKAPTSSLTTTNTSCGNSDGSITASVNVDNSNGDYVSYWNTGDQNTTTVSGLSPGTYYYNIIDDMGCKDVSTAKIIASDFQATGIITNPSCHNAKDGGINLSVTGGNGDINVLWSTGHSTLNLSSLEAGNYQVVLTDSDGCQITETFDLQNPSPFEIDYVVNSPDCGQANGAIDQFTSLGGTTPFTFNWSNGATTTEINGLSQGFYDVTVVDENGCQATKTFNLNSLGAPNAWIKKISKATCGESNGKIDINVSSFTGEQITGIQWSNGETTEDISNLFPGTYKCTISQSNGCDAVFNWNVGIAKPPKPEICIVTVDSLTNSNLLVWEKEENNPYRISHYNIYRETANIGQYQLIDTVSHSSISVFNDVVASPAVKSWRYRISAVNDCQIESNKSLEHKTIHLTMKDLVAGEVKVSWDNYEGFI